MAKCNWCKLQIGTNELKCLKCQGYLLAMEKFNKVIGDFLDKDYIEIIDIRDILDVLRGDIRENVESVDVDGKAYSRTSDIDNSIDAKEKEIKQKWIERLEKLKREIGIKDAKGDN